MKTIVITETCCLYLPYSEAEGIRLPLNAGMIANWQPLSLVCSSRAIYDVGNINSTFKYTTA